MKIYSSDIIDYLNISSPHKNVIHASAKLVYRNIKNSIDYLTNT